MKNTKISTLILLLILISFLTACSLFSPRVIKYTVNYISDGEIINTYIIYGNDNDEENLRPYLPDEKEDYTFAGWYDNEEYSGDQLLDYQAINKDKTYYAKWVDGYVEIEPILDFWKNTDTNNSYEVRIKNTATEDEKAVITELEIPPYYKGFPVTIIKSGFTGLENLQTLTIPNTITEIISKNEVGAFNNMDNLTTINFKENSTLKNIGTNCFYDCGITSLKIPDTVTDIGTSAFFSNPISDLTLGENVTNIGNEAFLGLEDTEFIIPSSVTTIGSSAFSNANDIERTIKCEASPTPGGWDYYWYGHENATTNTAIIWNYPEP